MVTIVVPDLPRRVFRTVFPFKDGKNPLDEGKPLPFQSVRGVFSITILNLSPSSSSKKCCQECPYIFSFTMAGGTGEYSTDPSRKFHYKLNTAFDNCLQPVEVKPAVNQVMIRTNEPVRYQIDFPPPYAIGQNTSFPTIQRLGIPPAPISPFTGDVIVIVEDSTTAIV